MKMKNFFSFVALGTALTLASCSSKTVGSDDAAQRLVAGEAPAFIISMKVKDLLDKGGISSKENVPMVVQMMLSEQVEYITNPEKIGLNFTGKSYIAMTSDGKKHAGWMLTGIKDKEAFEKMLKEEGHDKFEEVEGYNTISEKDQALIAWNESTLMIVGVSEGKAVDKFKSYLEMINGDKVPDAKYSKFFEATTDFAIFSDFEQTMAFQQTLPHEMQGNEREMEMVKKVAEKLKGTHSLLTINFENDKIVADFANNLSEAAKKELAFVGTTGFPKELLANLGSEELTGFISLNADVQQMLEWISSVAGEEDFLAQAREQSGLDIDRILGSFKGNLLMAFQGTKMSPDSFSEPRVTVIASLNNDYVQKVADSLFKSQKEGNYYALNKGFDPQYLGFKPTVLVFSNDTKSMDANGTPQLPAEAEKVFGKPFSFYFDLNHLIATTDRSGKTKGIAEKFKFAVGGMDLNGGHAELHLNNGGKNSLWTIINLGLESTASMMPNM